MKELKRGFGFGMSSAIITTIGVIIGLYSVDSRLIVILGGIISVAIADAFSDSFAIHISEESVNSRARTVWKTTFYTFFSKLFFALTFIIPFLFFAVGISVLICIIYGLVLISVYSYRISVENRKNPLKAILEHVLITIAVIVIVHFVGSLVKLII